MFPEVGSTMVPPGRRRPSCSAASIIAIPMRSFTDPPGFRNSSLARSWPGTSRPRRSSRTIGVRPTSSRTFGYSRPAIARESVSGPPQTSTCLGTARSNGSTNDYRRLMVDEARLEPNAIGSRARVGRLVRRQRRRCVLGQPRRLRRDLRVRVARRPSSASSASGSACCSPVSRTGSTTAKRRRRTSSSSPGSACCSSKARSGACERGTSSTARR